MATQKVPTLDGSGRVRDKHLPTRLGAGELSATFAPQPKNSIIPIGTSFTEGNYGPGTSKPLGYQARGYFVWAQSFLGQRLKWLRNAGVPGNTTAMMLARIDADVIAYAPGWCLIEVGPNDATTGVTAATTQANIAAMVDKLTGAGIRVAVTTPTTTVAQTTGQRQAALAVGEWLRAWAQTQPNLVIADFGSVWINPADGAPVTSLADDGTHPSPDGAIALGRVLADALVNRVPAIRDLPASNISTGNLLTNGMATGNVGGLATGFGVNGSGSTPVHTASKVARADGIPGEWQQLAIGPGNAAGRSMNWPTITTGFAVGDVVEALIEWKRVAGAVVVFGTTQQYLQAKLIAVGGSAEAVWCDRISSEKVWTAWPEGGVAKTPPLTIPAGTTSLVLQFSAAGVDTMTLQFGAAIVRKV